MQKKLNLNQLNLNVLFLFFLLLLFSCEKEARLGEEQSSVKSDTSHISKNELKVYKIGDRINSEHYGDVEIASIESTKENDWGNIYTFRDSHNNNYFAVQYIFSEDFELYELISERYLLIPETNLLALILPREQFSEKILFKIIDYENGNLVNQFEESFNIEIYGSDRKHFFNFLEVTLTYEMHDTDGPYLDLFISQGGYILVNVLYWIKFNAMMVTGPSFFSDYEASKRTNCSVKYENNILTINKNELIKTYRIPDILFPVITAAEDAERNLFVVTQNESDEADIDSYKLLVFDQSLNLVKEIQLADFFPYKDPVTGISFSEQEEDGSVKLIIDTIEFNYDMTIPVSEAECEVKLRASDFKRLFRK